MIYDKINLSLKEDMWNGVQMYIGHKRKVSLLDFNPLVADIISFTSVDYTIQVWIWLKASIILHVKPIEIQQA